VAISYGDTAVSKCANMRQYARKCAQMRVVRQLRRVMIFGGGKLRLQRAFVRPVGCMGLVVYSAKSDDKKERGVIG